MCITNNVKVQKRISSTSEIDYLFKVHKNVQKVVQVEEYTSQLWSLAYTTIQNERLSNMSIRLIDLDSEQRTNLRKDVRERVVSIFATLSEEMNNEIQVDLDFVPSFLFDITT